MINQRRWRIVQAKARVDERSERTSGA